MPLSAEQVYDLPKTRATAKALGVKRYFTGKPCSKGHLSARFASGQCIACKYSDPSMKRFKREWANKNRDHDRFSKRRSKIKNHETVALYNKHYQRSHRDLYAEAQMWQDCLNLGQIPGWVTAGMRTEIKGLYKEARRLSEETGVSREIDHIVPLKGKRVMGLHVPWNLQILTATENRRKHNHAS